MSTPTHIRLADDRAAQGHRPSRSSTNISSLLEMKLAVMERALYLLLIEIELDDTQKYSLEDRKRLAYAVENAWSLLRDEVRENKFIRRDLRI
jgi:hypothetical protein